MHPGCSMSKMQAEFELPLWGFPKDRDPVFEVLVIRVIIHWGRF